MPIKSFTIVENLVEDFAQLLVRYSKPVESRSEPEKGEIAARISVFLEDFYKPVGDSNDLNSEEEAVTSTTFPL